MCGHHQIVYLLNIYDDVVRCAYREYLVRNDVGGSCSEWRINLDGCRLIFSSSRRLGNLQILKEKNPAAGM